MKRLFWTVLLILGVASPAFAQVYDGVVTSYVDLYAGPDVGYPTIAQLPAGSAVSIQGCTEGWGWCDVIVGGNRGWVAGTFVQYSYQSQPVYVADYGARIGIPIITFSIAAYWGGLLPQPAVLPEPRLLVWPSIRAASAAASAGLASGCASAVQPGPWPRRPGGASAARQQPSAPGQ